MELRQLIYFNAVAEELHFGKASKKVHISQPALSLQIQQLEKELGGLLFVRTKQHVSLTDAGTIFWKHTKQILLQSEKAIHLTHESFLGNYGQLTIGFVESATWSVLPFVIKNYRNVYPDVKLTLQHLHTIKQIDAIKKNELDIGIIGLSPNDHDLDFHTIQSEPYVAAFSQEHPFCKKKCIKLSDLKYENFITTTRKVGPEYYDRVTQLCLKAGFSPKICQEADEMQTILSIVSCGMGIALIHKTAQNLRSDLVYKSLTGTHESAYELSLVWRKNCSQTTNLFVKKAIELCNSEFV